MPRLTLATTAILLATGSITAAAPAASASASVDAATATSSADVILDWERTALRTVFTESGRPAPGGVPYLAFTSLAVHDAVQRSDKRVCASGVAAAAAAAHGVLRAYFPDSQAALDTDLETSLDSVPDGPAQDRGVRLGERAAARMIESRAGDGREDPAIVYDRTPGPGVWAPAPVPGGMLTAWLGFMERVVTAHPVPVDGPPPLTSTSYAREYREVRRMGSATSTHRSAAQTETALFFGVNPAEQYGLALADRLEHHPIGLRRTARLFAAMHASIADALVDTWRLKYDVGYWRPVEAIAGAADDGNPATQPEVGWTPLVPTPPYSEYSSGHAAVTGSTMEVVRRILGDRTPLLLKSSGTGTERRYTRLSDIERDAFHARIWLGIHFRTAMADGYRIGHATARHVLRRLH